MGEPRHADRWERHPARGAGARREDPDDRRRYDRDGVVCLRGVFGPEWIEILRAGAERNMASPGPYAHTYAKDEADKNAYRVHVPEQIDVRAIRTNLGMTQDEFASQFGFSVNTLRHWT